jgi:hypothetical protein
VYHIDNARDLDSLLSLQGDSGLYLDIYEVNPLHTLSYAVPFKDCECVISASLPLLDDRLSISIDTEEEEDRSISALKSMLQSLSESGVTRKQK